MPMLHDSFRFLLPTDIFFISSDTRPRYKYTVIFAQLFATRGQQRPPQERLIFADIFIAAFTHIYAWMPVFDAAAAAASPPPESILRRIEAAFAPGCRRRVRRVAPPRLSFSAVPLGAELASAFLQAGCRQ